MRHPKYVFVGIIGIIMMLNSCYYKPFVGYRLNKKGFKNFSDRERITGDNSNSARDYKVNRYDWEIEVFPKNKSISGKMDISFTTESEQNTFLFDLQKKMKIISFKCSEGNPSLIRKHDFLYLKFEESVATNTRLKLSIEYEGKPANVAGEGPIQWHQDENERVWISTVTEGIGSHFIKPCNALLRAESDSSTISVTVPSNLTVVSNGQLIGVETNTEARTRTYKHEITNTINTYSLSFNVGNFVKFTKPYTDINGIRRDLTFHVLDYHQDTASKFYNQTLIILKEFEKLYGEYPFWKDGCKFIESTFSAMEHQSGIAMGSNYRNNWKEFNTTLIHELSHEWWGNSLTGNDYCDIWIHEGMATYSEALFLERIYGTEAYDLRMNFAIRSTKNTIPILKECDVLYNSWVNPADQDIYSKGALMMHSLRKIVDNDSLFFESLFLIQKNLPKQNISSSELILKFNTLLKNDYSSLFEWYLNKVKPPVLEVYLDMEDDQFYYKWEKEIPFYNNGEVFIKQGDEIQKLVPNTEYQSQKLTNSVSPQFLIEKSIYYLIEFQSKK
jgi:aminopeptidase N